MKHTILLILLYVMICSGVLYSIHGLIKSTIDKLNGSVENKQVEQEHEDEDEDSDQVQVQA